MLKKGIQGVVLDSGEGPHQARPEWLFLLAIPVGPNTSTYCTATPQKIRHMVSYIT